MVAKCSIRSAVAFAFMLGYALAAVAQDFGGGTGEPNDPYLIYTPAQLNEIGQYPETWYKHFKLMADLDLSDYAGDRFNVIGTLYGPFGGVFDGNGHIISGFNLTSAERDGVGLFGCVGSYAGDSSAAVKNLGLIDPNIRVEGRFEVGALVGSLFHGTVVNCCVRGGQVEGKRAANVGGLVGLSAFGHIVDCYATAAVSGDFSVGGLVAYNDSGTITTCYSAGSVVGNEAVGGLLGTNAGRVFQSFWDIEASGQSFSAGGTGKTTAEMHMGDTYRGWGSCDGEAIWTIDEGKGYPRLWWEQQVGQEIEATPLAELLDGSGTADDPLLIHTAEELNLVGQFPCDWDKHFRLMADLDLSAYEGADFPIIGYDWNEFATRPFTGVFDGNGHSIASFRYTCAPAARYLWRANVGLFGYVADPNAVIENLTLLDPQVDGGTGMNIGTLVGCLAQGCVRHCFVLNGSVSGGEAVGGLIGVSYGGSISDCNVEVSAYADRHVGGMIGQNEGDIDHCFVRSSVNGSQYVGGLVGWHQSGLITNSCSTSSVSGGIHVGGLVGFNSDMVIQSCSNAAIFAENSVGGLVGFNSGEIRDSYATGPVVGDSGVGGLVGHNASRNPGGSVVTNCYSSGEVSGNTYTGGLVGIAYGDILHSFWDVETSGQAMSRAGTGLTTAEMKQHSSFVDWDFETVWMICEDESYPHLQWEDIDCAD